MQSDIPVQLTQVPPKPTCNPSNIFTGSDCQDRINLYNQAVQQRQREELQLYVNRQKELASSQATAPLQQQIVDLNKLVTEEQAQLKKLQEQTQADSAAALQQSQAASTTNIQTRTSAHNEGLAQGTGIGVAASLLLFGLIFGIRHLRRSGSSEPKTRAASA